MYTTNNTSGKLGKGWAWGRGGESGGQSKQILKNELGDGWGGEAFTTEKREGYINHVPLMMKI